MASKFDYNEETFNTVKEYLTKKREESAPKGSNNAPRNPFMQGPRNNFDEVYPRIYIGNK